MLDTIKFSKCASFHLPPPPPPPPKPSSDITAIIDSAQMAQHVQLTCLIRYRKKAAVHGERETDCNRKGWDSTIFTWVLEALQRCSCLIWLEQERGLKGEWPWLGLTSFLSKTSAMQSFCPWAVEKVHWGTWFEFLALECTCWWFLFRW